MNKTRLKIRRRIWLLFAFLCGLIGCRAHGQTHVAFDFNPPYFNAFPASNRVFDLQAKNPFPGNLVTYTSGPSGTITVSNLTIGDYAGLIRAKGTAFAIPFQISISTNDVGLVGATNLTSVPGTQTWPSSGRSAWSIQASENRYATKGTTGVAVSADGGGSTTTNGSLVTVHVPSTNNLATTNYVAAAVAANPGGTFNFAALTNTPPPIVSLGTNNANTLSNLNASSLASGTIANARLSDNYLSALVGNQTVWDGSQSQRTFTFNLSGATDPQLNLANNSMALNVPLTLGNSLTPIAGKLIIVAEDGTSSSVTNNASSGFGFSTAVNAPLFSGSGALLTSLNATELRTGLIDPRRLSDTNGTVDGYSLTIDHGTNKYALGGSGISLAAVAGFANSNMVSKVQGHVPQPWNLTNTLVFVISDSFGYRWPEAFTNKYQWGGSGSPIHLLGFTNGTEGGTSIVQHTNNLETRIIPWLQTFSTNADVICLWGGGTIDQINGIATVGGVTNFNGVISNASVRLKGLGFHSMTFVRPSMIQAQNLGYNDGATDAPNDPLWYHNNWLVSVPTNIVDYVPDFFRRMNDNTDFRFFLPDGHPNATNGAALMADEVDEQLRGLRGRPLPYTAERIQNRWEWRDPADGAIRMKLWGGTNLTGSFQGLAGSYDGTFPPSTRQVQYGFQATGFGSNGHAGTFVGQPNQNTWVAGIQPSGGGPNIEFWDGAVKDISIRTISGRAIFAGARIDNNTTLEFTNGSGRRMDLFMSSGGRWQLRELPSGAEIFAATTNAASDNVFSVNGSVSANLGFVRSNIFTITGDTLNTSHDIVILNGVDIGVTLPTAVGKKGRPFTLINSNATPAIITRTSGQTLGGIAADLTLFQGQSLNIISDDANWLITSDRIGPAYAVLPNPSPFLKTNYTIRLQPGGAKYVIYTANTNIDVTLANTSAGNSASIFVNAITSSVNCVISLPVGLLTNANWHSTVTNGTYEWNHFVAVDGTSTNVTVTSGNISVTASGGGSGVSVAAGNNITATTNGSVVTVAVSDPMSVQNVFFTNVVYAFKAAFSTNYTVTTNDMILALTGTNQLITLPNGTNGPLTPSKLFTFLMSSTTGYGSAIITNANGVQTVRTAAGLSDTITNGQSLTLIWDGANWR